MLNIENQGTEDNRHIITSCTYLSVMKHTYSEIIYSPSHIAYSQGNSPKQPLVMIERLCMVGLETQSNIISLISVTTNLAHNIFLSCFVRELSALLAGHTTSEHNKAGQVGLKIPRLLP